MNVIVIYVRYMENVIIKELIKKMGIGVMKSKQQEEIEVVNDILEQCTLLTDGDTGRVFRYQDGVYKLLTINQLDHYITTEYLNNDLIYNRQKKNICLDILRSSTYINSRIIEDSIKGTINLRNGVYYFDKIKGIIAVDFKPVEAMVHFRAHDKNRMYYSFNQLPVEYNSEAKCPSIDKFIAEVFGEDRVDDIYEFIGYLLVPHVKYQRAMIMIGSGKNGKTTFLDMITEFLGEDNIAQIPLQYLDGKFALYNLKNKSACIVSDLPAKDLNDTGNAKRVVTDKRLSSNIKNIQGNFEFDNRCKMLYSVNTLPRSKDKSSAFYRRWCLYICDAVFEENKDVNIFDKLTTPEELSGLFNKALEGYERLVKKNGFKDTEDEVREIWELESNPIAEFIMNRCAKGTEFEYKSRDLFEAFNEFRATKGKSTLHPKSIGHWLRQYGIVGKQRQDQWEEDKYGNPKWFTFYQGIKEKPLEIYLKKDSIIDTFGREIVFGKN